MAKLTPQQWNKLKKRRDAGESTAQLAKEFGVSRRAIYDKLGEPNSEVKSVAKHIIDASESLHKTLQTFTATSQSSGWDMAADLVEISRHSCKGALYSAMTFHKFSMIAHESAEKSAQLGAIDGLADKVIADQYQESANEAFKPVAALMNKSNAETLGKIGGSASPEKPKTLNDFYAQQN